MPNIHTYTIGAYTPYYDAKQLAEPSVVGGKNFMPTTSGYKSAFGSDVLTDRYLDPKLLLNAQAFSLAEDAFVICNRYGILRYDESSEGFYYLVKSENLLTSSYPWSVAYVGGDWFFCKKGFGVWRYRIDENSGMFVVDNVPSEPLSICSAGGRLVILGSSTYAWSAIGDGTNLVTSLETGAGFQALSLIGGAPLAVRSNTIGFMVYTTAGIIRVEELNLTKTPNPYQHKVLAASDYAPVSAWAVCEIGTGTHVFLTKSGLYATSGDYPKILEKDFSKWLTQTTLKYLLQSRYDLPLAINYDATRRAIILSYAEYSITASPYSLAYVLDIELAKWGRFDRNHYFITSCYIPKELYKGYRSVCATTDGAIRILDKDFGWSKMASHYYRDNYPVAYRPSFVNYVKNDLTEKYDTYTTFSAAAQLETYDFTKLGINAAILGVFDWLPIYWTIAYNLDMPQGYRASYVGTYTIPEIYCDMYDSSLGLIDMANLGESDDKYIDMANVDGQRDSVTIFTSYANCDARFCVFREIKVVGELQDLDSELKVGLYHIPDFDDLKCSTVMTGFAMMHEQTVGDSEFIDMQEVQDINIDMETFDNEIDMGIDFLSSPNYKATLISSSDGYGHRNLHINDIKEYSIVGDRFNYNSYSTGLYHGFTLATAVAGGYYHLKQIQVNIIQGGLIYDGA